MSSSTITGSLTVVYTLFSVLRSRVSGILPSNQFIIGQIVITGGKYMGGGYKQIYFNKQKNYFEIIISPSGGVRAG